MDGYVKIYRRNDFERWRGKRGLVLNGKDKD